MVKVNGKQYKVFKTQVGKLCYFDDKNDNVKYIKFNFSGKSYLVTRDNVINSFPNYNDIINNGKVNRKAFNKYLEAKINDEDFIDLYFNKFVS